jgi:hypothetical protein
MGDYTPMQIVNSPQRLHRLQPPHAFAMGSARTVKPKLHLREIASPLKRRPSTGNTHSQPPGAPPTPVPEHASGQHGRYAPASSGGHKSRPVPIPTNSAHIYS